tara:strand:+ start:166 stop:297 length:132 start_codon:yes stop_codon:yes gene_type:complete
LLVKGGHGQKMMITQEILVMILQHLDIQLLAVAVAELIPELLA